MNSDRQPVTCEWLKVNQAATYLSVSRTWIYQLMEKGELPYAKVGKCRRISRQALETFMQSMVRQ